MKVLNDPSDVAEFEVGRRWFGFRHGDGMVWVYGDEPEAVEGLRTLLHWIHPPLVGVCVVTAIDHDEGVITMEAK